MYLARRALPRHDQSPRQPAVLGSIIRRTVDTRFIGNRHAAHARSYPDVAIHAPERRVGTGEVEINLACALKKDAAAA